MVFNLVGVGAGFYFPQQAILFVLTSNAMIQVYESSKLINKIKDIA